MVEVDERLVRGFEDWQVMLALHQVGNIHAFVTQDGNILKSPTEMYVLSQIKLCLVVTDDTGQNPIRATGLLMAGLDVVARRVANEKHRILRLSMQPKPIDVGEQFNKIAQNKHMSPRTLFNEAKTEVGELDVLVVPPVTKPPIRLQRRQPSQ